VITSLYKATYGILFFGTPHKGLVIADIRKMIAEDDNHPRSTLLKEIDEKSALLLSQLSDFKNVIRDRKIVSFYEQSQTQGLVKVGV
jgi:protein SERAC1